MASTSVTYNGVEMSMVETNSINTEAVYDESGAQIVAWRTTGDFVGVIHERLVSDMPGDIAALQKTMMKPRKTLTIALVESGTTTLYNITAAGGGLTTSDVDNGPMPISATIDRIVGGRTLLVRFSVRWTIAARTESGQPYIIGHRWSQTFAVDNCNYTTRTVEGVVSFSTFGANTPSDAATAIDRFRAFIYPKSIPGYIRKRAQFAITSDQKFLRYVVEDQEGYRKFPGIAMDGSGRYVTRLEGGIAYAHFQITLKGQKGANPGLLTQAAFNAMRTRMNLSSPSAGGDLITSIEFDENLFANEITLTANSMPKTGNNGYLFAASRHFLPLETLSPTDAGKFNQPSPYGVSAIMAAAEAYFDITSNTETNPSSVGQIGRASVIGATNPDGTTIGVEAIQIPPVDDPSQLLSTITDSDTGAVTSPQQNESTRYLEAGLVWNVTANNNVVVLHRADPTVADEVQQTAKPEVVVYYYGEISRVGKIPQIPQVVGTLRNPGQSSTRYGYIRNSQVKTLAPAPSGNGADLIYKIAYSYEVVIPFNTTNFSTQTTTDGKFVVFSPGDTVPFPESPQLGSDGTGQNVADPINYPANLRL